MPTRRPSSWLFPLLIAAAAGIVYSGSLDHPFLFDDMGSVVHNPQIRSLDPEVALAPPVETPVGGRPVVNLSFAINYAAGGLDPAGFHLVNILLHIGNALLLFGIVRRLAHLRLGKKEPARRSLGEGGAAAVALLWAVHPLNSEAVNYMTQRTELLMALFFLTTMYASVRAWERSRASLWTTVAVLACAAGMACKETMVTAPVAVLVLDRIFRYGSWAETFRERRLLYGGFVVAWGVLILLMLNVPRTSGSGFATTHVSTWTYLLNQSEMLVRYARLAIWPDALVLYYGWATPRTLAEVWPYVALVLAALAGTVVLLVRAPRLGYLAFFVFLTLAPTSSIVPIGSEVGAERRMYLPLAGLVTLAVVAIGGLAERQRVQGGAIAVGVVAVVFGYLTVERTKEYATPLGMAQTVLERWPTPTAHYMVGTELVTAGRLAESISHLRQAASAIPPARYNLGSALFTSGQREEGMRELETFLREEPDLISARDARLLLARGYAESGRAEESLVIARQVLTRAPDDHAANALVAEALMALGRFDEAIPHFQAYLRVQGDDGAGWTGLGIAFIQLGRMAEAVAAFQRAVASSPDHAGYRMNLARALIDAGQFAAAREHADRAVQLTQGDPAALELQARARGGVVNPR